ncbi:PC-esterase domain-containing protein 1B-like isoform X2 [Paroedura picta]|uniref:PC-esterase domain-containing protein 1B-like isoform X2 n=1 Tax=Paroedura picta TaxID=143630 RepID=UPI0040571BFE
MAHQIAEAKEGEGRSQAEVPLSVAAMQKRPLGDVYDFSSEEARKLLHNKFVVILGDSIQRTIYKDLVRFLQDEEPLTLAELTCKGWPRFWNDHLVEFDELHNETHYREVRQYRSDHHLVRTYFICQAYSGYVESILEDFKAGPVPDLLILNSCLWDLNRYNIYSPERLAKSFREYRENLQTLFWKLHDTLPASCLVVWNMNMPVGPDVRGAYLNKGMKGVSKPTDVLIANFEGAVLACCYQFDVLDLSFAFRFLEEYRHYDGVHWNSGVHRQITKLLLTHVAKEWGVELKKERPQNGVTWNRNAKPRYRARSPLHTRHNSSFQSDAIPDSSSFCGFINFEDTWEPPAPSGELQYGDFHGPSDYALDGGQAVPCPFPAGEMPPEEWRLPVLPHMNYMPNGGQGLPPPRPPRSPRGFRGRHHNGRVMRHQRFHGEHYRPYVMRPQRFPGPHAYPPHDASWPPFQGPPYPGEWGWRPPPHA